MFFFTILVSYFAFSQNLTECREPVVIEGKYSSFTTRFYCAQGQQEILEEKKFFNKTGTPSTIKYFDNKKLVKFEAYNINYELVTLNNYEHLEDETFYWTTHRRQKGQLVLTDKFLYKGSPESEDKAILKEWVFDKDEDNNNEMFLKAINLFDGETKTVQAREVYKEGQMVSLYEYKHLEDPTIYNYIDGFTKYGVGGEKLADYSFSQGIDVETFILRNAENKKEAERKIKILNDSSREQVLIIDSGFDLAHPDLAHKFYKNSEEIVDGFDNDGNGVVDDVYGVYAEEAGTYTNNTNERLTLNRKNGMAEPFSHGTHVASLALKDLERHSMVVYSGNMSDPYILGLAADVAQKRQIKFANMSFSYGSRRGPVAPGSASFLKLRELIKNNPQMLSVVAAGNDGIDLDQSNPEYPASYDFENLLVVGALNTDSLEEDKMQTYTQASFSTRGVKSVDVFAPGVDVLGANVGGDHIRVSGTSMASPFALNEVLKISEVYPEISIQNLKSILLLSAYIPDLDHPFDCVSGGMIYPRRAMALAKAFSMQPEADLRRLALKVRTRPELMLLGEDLGEGYLNRLDALWTSRGL